MSTFTSIIPLQAVLLQFLWLLMAIALEALIFYHYMELSRKTSIEYAAAINLFTTVLGWITFFGIQHFIPLPWKAEMISYIFFDHFINSSNQYFIKGIIVAGFFLFWAAFIVKLKILEVLEKILGIIQPDLPTLNHKSLKSLPLKSQKINQATVILLANACSYSAILLILFLRSIQTKSYYN